MLKCQLPFEQLDSFISVSTDDFDEDLDNLADGYERMAASCGRMADADPRAPPSHIFLFSPCCTLVRETYLLVIVQWHSMVKDCLHRSSWQNTSGSGNWMVDAQLIDPV